SADDEDFARIARLEECIAFAEGDFGLIDFDDSLQWFAVRIDHRSPQLLRQQPGGLIGDAELVLQLPRRHAVGMRRHEMRGPEPCRQRQLGAMHRRARDDRSLTFASKAFVCVRGSSVPLRDARHSGDRQNRWANAAPTRKPRNSPRRETSLETAIAIGPWPLTAPSRPLRTAA